MNRTERHHLKDNELAQFAAGARELMESSGRSILWVVIAVVVVVAVAGGYVGWKNRVEGRAHSRLADALAIEDARVGPPAAFGSAAPTGLSFVSQREKSQAALTKLKEVADDFPTSDAGLYARYRQAATYMALDVPKSAADAYQQVINQGGDSLYAQMAKLGLAEAQAESGDFDQAITTFRDLSQHKDGPLPVDGVLLELGRTQVEAGKANDAQQTFNRLVQEFPDSSFAADAKKDLDAMKKTS